MQDQKYPMAEVFDSIKGEGLYTGVAMRFLRFAGCNVGKVAIPDIRPIPLVGPHLTERSEAKVCHTYDNRPFFCDTDFNKYEERTIDELLEGCWQERVVITGGEPLTHKATLAPLLVAIHEKGKMAHLETSGTIDWSDKETEGVWFDWIACAPKRGFLPQLNDVIDEYKLLVDEHFNVRNVPQCILEHDRVYLQPVNPPYGLDRANLERCFELQKTFPRWIVSPQLHKLLGVK